MEKGENVDLTRMTDLLVGSFVCIVCLHVTVYCMSMSVTAAGTTIPT